MTLHCALSPARFRAVAPVNEERKKDHGLKGRKKTAVQRLRMSRSHTGKKLSPETKAKISRSMKQFKNSNHTSPDILTSMTLSLQQEKKDPLDYFVMEKAVLELSELRREVARWLQSWYALHDRKPSLEEVSRTSPEIHNKFLRYIALQGYIRSNS